MTVGSNRSLRVAKRLVAQAGNAFAEGDDDIGRQLLAEAATMYDRAGEADEAARVRGLAARPSTPPLVEPSTGNETPMPDLLPGAPLVEQSAPMPVIVGSPIAAPARPEPAPLDPPAAVATWSVDQELPDPPVVSAPPARNPTGVERDFARRYWARLGRSPAVVAEEEYEADLAIARGLRAHAFAAQLQRLRTGGSSDPIEVLLDEAVPEEAVTAEVEPSLPGGVPEDAGVEESAPSSDLVLDLMEDFSHEASGSASAQIAEAIDELVGDISTANDVSLGDAEIGKLSPAEMAAPEDLTGVVIRGRFRIERRVGRGAQAQVFLARDQVLDRAVAIKVLSPHLVENPEALEGFLAEARMAAKVNHAGCLSVFDFGREGDLTFLAMEFFRGRSLRSLLRGGALEPYLALHLGRDLAEALAAVHAAGIVHRDVKPSNVLVDRTARSKLTDFGVAISADARVEEGMMVGTLRYMAPEQARGRGPDPRSDLFSLGAVLWEMLVGRPCYEPTVDALKARMNQPPPELPEEVDVPAEVRELVVRCMSPRPEARPASAGRLASRLRRGLERLEVEKARREDGA